MGTILAIIDKDQEYLKALMDYMKSKKEFTFTIVAFSNGEAYLNYEQSNSVSILLYQENYDAHVIENSKACQKICLRENKNASGKDGNNIFKYQSANQIIKEILRLYEGEKEEDILNKADANSIVISLCSPVQFTYSSMIARALAYEYSKKKRTLFLSFDPFFSAEIMGCKENVQGISDLIYYAKQSPSNLSTKILSLVNKKETLDYIIGVAHWSDVSELAENDLEQVLQVIKEQLGYEIIIIDIGAMVNVTTSLLENSNYIFQIDGRGSYAQHKEKEFRRQLGIKVGMNIINRFASIAAPREEIDEECWRDIKSDRYQQLVKDLITRCSLNKE